MKNNLDKNDLSCPSARCAPGATVIGALAPDGKIRHFKTPIVADKKFVDTAKQNGSPERVFRFSSKCQTGECSQWTGDRCGVADMVEKFMSKPKAPPKAAEPPPCVIRSTCRWYAQSGPEICLSCAYVITDNHSA